MNADKPYIWCDYVEFYVPTAVFDQVNIHTFYLMVLRARVVGTVASCDDADHLLGGYLTGRQEVFDGDAAPRFMLEVPILKCLDQGRLCRFETHAPTSLRVSCTKFIVQNQVVNSLADDDHYFLCGG